MARITVTPADEDEVIVAGIATTPSEGPTPSANDAVATAGEPSVGERVSAPSNREQEPAVSAARVPLQASEQAPAATTPSQASADARPSQAPSTEAPKVKGASASQPKRAKDAYRETTLEDLEPASMPLAQRIVIVAAVVCIIGAIVYYFLAMR